MLVVVAAGAALSVLGLITVLVTIRSPVIQAKLQRRRRPRRPEAPFRLQKDDTTALRGRAYERSALVQRIQSSEIERVPARPPASWSRPDPELLGTTRRQFLNRSIVGFTAFGLSGFGASLLAFLWPTTKGGFGSVINVGNINDVKAKIRANKNFLYVPDGRMWLTEYPTVDLPKATKVYSAPVLIGMRAGLVALWQTCPHLGCRVPACYTSQWFECPCHGSKYNRVGEKKAGPAPRGMDRFGVTIDGANNFLVNTGALFQGPPIGTNTTGQEAEGPLCVGQASHAG